MSRRGLTHSSLAKWGVAVVLLLSFQQVGGQVPPAPCNASQLQNTSCADAKGCWNACAFWRCGLRVADCNRCCSGNFGDNQDAYKKCLAQCTLVYDGSAVPSGQTCPGCFAPCPAQQLADKSCQNPGTCTNACAANNTAGNCASLSDCRACCAAFAADSPSQQQCREFCRDGWILPPPGGG